ncbi:MAG: hypothetical protein ACE5OV_02830 [Candidatus Bathyarchaeia archaeon]
MLGLLAIASWVSLTAYSTWLFGMAKQYQAMSPKDVRFLWRVHKHVSRCNAPYYVKKYNKKKNIVGFKCSCGYEYESKRPII